MHASASDHNYANASNHSTLKKNRYASDFLILKKTF